MNTVIYLTEQPLDNRNYERFGVQSWIDRGWKVEVWDLTPLAYPRVWQHFAESGQQLKEWAGYCPMESGRQVRSKCSGQGRIAYYVDMTGDHYHSLRAKVRLARCGATRVLLDVGSMPEVGDGRPATLVARIRKAARRSVLKSLKLLGDTVAARVAGSLVKPGLIVVSGDRSIADATRLWPDVELVRAHNLDYDLYLGLVQTEARSRARYALFLDQDLCGHSDFVYQGVPFAATPERYYPGIRRGLRKISEDLGLEVRVAAHPRASYRRAGSDPFGGLPIEHGRTAELIRDSQVVVCHHTTAIQLAVLFGKPIVFLTTAQLEASVAGRLIALFAAELGKAAISVDGDLDRVDFRRELGVDAHKYAAYRSNYIKSKGSPEKPLWDIVIDHIEKIARPAPAGSRVLPTSAIGER